jgi:hypothetical protein
MWGDRAAEQYEKDQPSEYAPTGQVIAALHPGQCPKCEHVYDVGTQLHKTDAGWICCP